MCAPCTAHADCSITDAYSYCATHHTHSHTTAIITTTTITTTLSPSAARSTSAATWPRRYHTAGRHPCSFPSHPITLQLRPSLSYLRTSAHPAPRWFARVRCDPPSRRPELVSLDPPSSRPHRALSALRRRIFAHRPSSSLPLNIFSSPTRTTLLPRSHARSRSSPTAADAAVCQSTPLRMDEAAHRRR